MRSLDLLARHKEGTPELATWETLPRGDREEDTCILFIIVLLTINRRSCTITEKALVESGCYRFHI